MAPDHLAFHDVPGAQLPLPSLVDPPEVPDQMGPPEGSERAVLSLALEVNRLEVGRIDVVEHCSQVPGVMVTLAKLISSQNGPSKIFPTRGH